MPKHQNPGQKKDIPWLTQEERRRMLLLRRDLERQLARKGGFDPELESGIRTLGRELAFDSAR